MDTWKVAQQIIDAISDMSPRRVRPVNGEVAIDLVVAPQESDTDGSNT